MAEFPAFAPVDRASEILGLSRRTIYELLGSGELKAKKRGTATLVDITHALKYIETLPDAKIKPSHKRAVAE